MGRRLVSGGGEGGGVGLGWGGMRWVVGVVEVEVSTTYNSSSVVERYPRGTSRRTADKNKPKIVQDMYKVCVHLCKTGKIRHGTARQHCAGQYKTRLHYDRPNKRQPSSVAK